MYKDNHPESVVILWVCIIASLTIGWLLWLTARHDDKMLDSLDSRIEIQQERELDKRDQEILDRLRYDSEGPTIGSTPVPDDLHCEEDEAIAFSPDAPRHVDSEGRDGYGLGCVNIDEL